MMLVMRPGQHLAPNFYNDLEQGKEKLGRAKASFSRDSATAGSTGSNATAEVAGYSLATRSTRSLSAPISGYLNLGQLRLDPFRM